MLSEVKKDKMILPEKIMRATPVSIWSQQRCSRCDANVKLLFEVYFIECTIIH